MPGTGWDKWMLAPDAFLDRVKGGYPGTAGKRFSKYIERNHREYYENAGGRMMSGPF